MTLQSFLDQCGVTYQEAGQHHHARPNWIQVDCPDCSPGSGRFRMGINLKGVWFNCWTCGPKRSKIATLCSITGQSVSDCASFLQGHTTQYEPEEIKPTGKLQLPKGLGKLDHTHRYYLRKRGFHPPTIRELWGIQGITYNNEQYKWRIFIPILYRDKIVSWTTRSIVENESVRYRSASLTEESIPHKDLLYGEDYVRSTIIIHEGPLDVWATGPGSVATFGTSYSSAQVAKMSKYPVRVICFDYELDAQRRARDLARELMAFPGETFLTHYESGKDAASADKAEVLEFRKRFLGE